MRARGFLTAWAAGAACALGTAGTLAAQAPEPAPFIQVSGMGQVFVESDRARVNFAVVTEGTNAADAAARNATQMDAVIRALRGTGAAGLQIESWGYDLQPRYARQTSGEQMPRIIGYQVSNNVRATIDDVTVVGKVIDAGINAGSNRVTSLTFEARNTDAARAEALRMAVQNAHSQAQAMAAAMGVTLGPPLEVQGGAQAPVPPPMPYMRSMEMAQAPVMVDTPIQAAEQSVSAHVSIKYRIGTR